MILKLSFIILLSLVSQRLSFKAADLCTYSSKIDICDGKYGFQCGDRHCSVNEASCDYYQKMSFQSRTYQNYDLRMRKYQLYKSTIKDCPSHSNHHKTYAVCKKSNLIIFN